MQDTAAAVYSCFTMYFWNRRAIRIYIDVSLTVAEAACQNVMYNIYTRQLV